MCKIRILLKKYNCLILIFFIILSCVTDQAREPIALPVIIQPSFSSCSTSDGSLALNLHSKKGKSLKITLDWLVNTRKSWEIQAVDPLGRIYSHFKLKDSSLHSEILNKKVPIAVRKDNFLELDGHFLAWKAEEIPCLLLGVLPVEWLSLISRFEKTSSGWKAFIFSSQRKMTISWEFNKETLILDPICVEITWSRFWGLKSEHLRWCLNSAKKRNYLSLPYGYELNWSQLE